MNIERGATNHLIVTGRETLVNPYYLLVFQQVVNKSNYEYVVAQNSGSSTGPLILEILETDNADPFDAEVTLGTGDWHMAVYEQSDPENLDASLAGRRVTSELVRVVSDSTDEPVYPPAPGSCDFDVQVYVDGDFVQTVSGLDPCEDNSLTINITYS